MKPEFPVTWSAFLVLTSFISNLSHFLIIRFIGKRASPLRPKDLLLLIGQVQKRATFLENHHPDVMSGSQEWADFQ